MFITMSVWYGIYMAVIMVNKRQIGLQCNSNNTTYNKPGWDIIRIPGHISAQKYNSLCDCVWLGQGGPAVHWVELTRTGALIFCRFD